MCPVGLLLLCLVPGLALAGEWSIVGGVGGAFFRHTVDDGTWRQDGVQAPNTRLLDQAWTVGVDYRIDPRWSVQGSYFDWGSAQVKSRFVSDADYDPVNHRCLANCAGTYAKVRDRLWGYELTVTRHFPLTDRRWEPFLKAGAAVAFHEQQFGNGQSVSHDRYHGAIPMVVVGGGVCYQGRLCWDNAWHMGTLSMNSGCLNGGQYDCGYPLTKQVATSMLLIKIPFARD